MIVATPLPPRARISTAATTKTTPMSTTITTTFKIPLHQIHQHIYLKMTPPSLHPNQSTAERKREQPQFWGTLIPYLNKTPDKIIIHICTNDGLSSNKITIYMTIKKIKKLIKTHHPDCKNIFIFFPILRADNKKAANILKSNIINILKREKHNVILR